MPIFSNLKLGAMMACVGALIGIHLVRWTIVEQDLLVWTHRLLVFFSLIELLGSLNQLISVPSIMIPMVSPSAPSRVETDRTVAFMIMPR
jgi:hypothetical protein